MAVKKVVKGTRKPGAGRRSRRGRPKGTAEEKKEAARLGITVDELRTQRIGAILGESKPPAKPVSEKPKAKPVSKKPEDSDEPVSKAATPREKHNADELGISVRELREKGPAYKLAVGGKGKAEKLYKKQVKGLSKGRAKAVGRLRKAQIKEEKDWAGSPTRLEVEAPKGTTIEGQKVQVGDLPSKVELEPKLHKYSRKRLRNLITTGQAKLVWNKKSKRYVLVNTGRYAPPREEIAKAMGVKPEMLPTGKDLDELLKGWGFQTDPLPLQTAKKKGGKIKYYKGGGGLGRTSTKPRGVGAARTGWGCVSYG